MGGLKCKSSEFGTKNQNLMMGALKQASLNSIQSISNTFKTNQGQENEKNVLGINELQSPPQIFGTTTNFHGKRSGQLASPLAGSYDSFLQLRQRKEHFQQQAQQQSLFQVHDIHSAEHMCQTARIQNLEEAFNGNDQDNLGDQMDETESQYVASQTKERRGPTMLLYVQTRPFSERKPIFLNELNQPIGPDEATLNEFSYFLGTVARKEILAPLNYADWRKVSTKEKIWEFVNVSK